MLRRQAGPGDLNSSEPEVLSKTGHLDVCLQKWARISLNIGLSVSENGITPTSKDNFENETTECRLGALVFQSPSHAQLFVTP